MMDRVESPTAPSGAGNDASSTSGTIAADSAIKIVPPSEDVSKGESVVSKISREIGTGDAAKDSFVYLTIRWSFLVGAITTLAIFVKGFMSCPPDDSIEMVKNVWSVFMPVITLALGYAFGKGR